MHVCSRKLSRVYNEILESNFQKRGNITLPIQLVVLEIADVFAIWRVGVLHFA